LSKLVIKTPYRKMQPALSYLYIRTFISGKWTSMYCTAAKF